ncbi:MAG: alpha-D-ribose 1-methylphosphonate 5-triphosphate diphosphatase [Albidovulum sp.]|uniref:alpha-D-ribose 1-methylphosphonate 5-triphosphate diphosphatase n=1 Tax=Albidovulum sp. TaxID=1872424 RepID=UPI003CA27E3D
MTETILANANIVLPTEVITGSLVMRGGMIADIAAGTAVPPDAIDCEGDLVMPGLVELHTDNIERHLQPRPAVDWPHGAAILAHDAELCSVGVTTVFDALRVGSVVSDGKTNYGEYARQLADELLQMRAANALRISHFIHLRAEVCSETLIEELDKFGADDRIGIVSLMDHTPGERQFRDLAQLRTYVRGKHGLTEDEFLAHVESQIALRERLGADHEKAAVAAARRFGATLASHDDTTAAQVARSVGHGVQFAEFPTTFEAAEACRAHGIAVMMGAPNLIRGGSHSGNVAAHVLADADLLDIVSSDYVPSSLLGSALFLGDLWGDVARGIRTVTANPACAVGLTDRGRLIPGARADLLRVRRAATSGSGSGSVLGVWVKGDRVG